MLWGCVITGWLIACIVFLALVLIGFVRVGILISYAQDGFRVRARLGRLFIMIYPPKPGKDKKPKKTKARAEKDREPEKAGDFERFRALIKPALDSFGTFISGLRVDILSIDYTVASDDAAKTAMLYGFSAAGVGGVLPLLERIFVIKSKNIRITADFNRTTPVILFDMAISIPIWRVFKIGTLFMFEFIKNHIRTKKQSKVV